MLNSKVNNIVDRIKEDRVEEFYFKNGVPDGYNLKLVKDDSIIDSIYLTKEEAEVVLSKLHFKTDSILFTIFKLDFEREAYYNRMLSIIHDLGMLKRELLIPDVSEEELLSMLNLIKQLTKDKELSNLDVNGMQKEQLYNIIHRKHLEYYSQYKDIILTEVISGSYSS